jgi:hypothetical protein
VEAEMIGEDYRAKKAPDEWYLDLEQLRDNHSVAQVVRNKYIIKGKSVYYGYQMLFK